jgi:hypothetical protein
MDRAADPGRRRLLLVVIFAVAILAALVAGLFLVTSGRSMSTPEGVEAMFERSPSEREATRALKANFPDDYRQLLGRMARVHRERGREAAMAEGDAFMTRFMSAKVNAIAAAPDRSLQRIAGATLAMIKVLRDENVAQCAQFTTEGLAAEARLSANATEHLTRLSIYLIEAARAGEAPGRTPRPQPSQADIDAWWAAMRAIDPVATRRLEDEDGTGHPPESQCRDGLVAYEAVTRLPGPAAASVTALLLRESFAPTQPGQ